MSDNRDIENLSNGFLPRGALSHHEPTAVGLWDLDSSQEVWRPEPPVAGSRDQLLTVRLHGQPVATVHIDEPPGVETRSSVIAAAWSSGSSMIRSHVDRFGCIPAVDGAEELDRALKADAGVCKCLKPGRPAGAAAVIVSTIGRESALIRCFDSLARLRGEDFEVIVVDNRPSSPVTRTLVERYSSKLKIRYVSEPRVGVSAARNTGLLATEAAFLAFADDDVVVDDQWLVRLLESFCDEAVQAVTGLVLPRSLLSPVQKRFEQYAGFGKGLEPKLYDMDEHRAEDRFLYPYFGGVFGSGNNMAFRRHSLLAIGGFDLALGPGTPTGGGEDIVAFTDVVLAGGRIAYQPAAICWHEHRADEAALKVQVRNYGIALAATFWHYLWKDRRFAATILRSVPLTLEILAKRRHHRGQAVVPLDLLRLESRARWSGPWHYMISRRNARRGPDRETPARD
jgi:GT2 family glycosyltransferase